MSHLVAPDRAVLALAGRQHGAVSWAQLREAGATEGWIRHRVRTGWLRRLHRGAYLVGPLVTPHSAAMAAALAIGGRALLSHSAAAALWGFWPPGPGAIDVTAPDRKRSRPGIRVHQAHLHPRDATRHHGIPVTSPARTLLDLAVEATSRELERATEEAQVQRRVSVHSLHEQFSRYPRHRGTAALRAAIRSDPKLTRSEAERLLLELVREAGLPEPETNARVAGHEVDFLWREEKLIVEVDGYAFHSMRSSFERDRRKGADLTAAGFRLSRVTWRQLVAGPVGVIGRLATALAA